MLRYVGRFAPSPTGPLHAGSVVAALASWLDARAQGGTWLVRIEDVDSPRCAPGAAETVLAQLDALGLRPDEAPLWQSQRHAAYQAGLSRLLAAGQAYPCGCSRQDIERALAAAGQAPQRFGERVYPGTCRSGLHGRPARAWRLRADDGSARDVHIDWSDRRLGPQQQNLTQAVGDIILRRADGLWASRLAVVLAVVVDDSAQVITDVVRGADLCDNTARQIHLQRLLGLPTPRYLHTPLVLAAAATSSARRTRHGLPTPGSRWPRWPRPPGCWACPTAAPPRWPTGWPARWPPGRRAGAQSIGMDTGMGMA